MFKIGGGYSLFISIITAAAVYTVVPDFILHWLGIGVWKRQYTPGVALTFDDGPNPDITPQILDILDRYRLKATFFVVGERAAAHPALIKLIRSRGHSIGAHCMHHRFAWFMSPWKTWREWEKCIHILEELTGEKIDWIRPPWGTFNLATWLWMKFNKKQAVLWNAEGHDWQVRRNPQSIAARVLRHTREGTIILLHDAGGDKGAPVNTLNTLEPLCRKIIEDKKLPLMPLEFPQWSWNHKLIASLWSEWEHLFENIYRVERISSTNIFRLSRTRYKGPELYAEDGQLLAKSGDMVGEIHLDSLRLQNHETNITKRGVHLIKQARNSMPVLARYIDKNRDYQDIKVFVGLTLINQGAKSLGFQVQEMPATLFIRVVGMFQKLILLFYRASDKNGLNKHMQNHPRLVWISKQKLLENWL